MRLAELEKEVQKLSPGELAAFTCWFEEYAATRWDDQIERDIASGKLNKLGQKADAIFKAGQHTEL